MSLAFIRSTNRKRALCVQTTSSVILSVLKWVKTQRQPHKQRVSCVPYVQLPLWWRLTWHSPPPKPLPLSRVISKDNIIFTHGFTLSVASLSCCFTLPAVTVPFLSEEHLLDILGAQIWLQVFSVFHGDGLPSSWSGLGFFLPPSFQKDVFTGNGVLG